MPCDTQLTLVQLLLVTDLHVLMAEPLGLEPDRLSASGDTLQPQNTSFTP